MKLILFFIFLAASVSAQTFTATEVANGQLTGTALYSTSTKTYTVTVKSKPQPINRLVTPLRFEDVEPVDGSGFNVANTQYWQVEPERCSAPDGATWTALWLVAYDRYNNELCRFGVDAGSLITKGQMSCRIGGATYRLCNQIFPTDD